MEILIKTPSDLDESERMMALVEGLEKAELCKLSTALVVMTDDEQVAGLLARYGTRLDAVPVVVPAEKKIARRKPQRSDATDTTYTDPETGEVYSFGSVRQLIRSGKIAEGHQFINQQGQKLVLQKGKRGQLTFVGDSAPLLKPEPAPVPTPEPEPVPALEPVERRKKTGRPTRGITSTLASDLQKIVAEAGMKALKGEPQRTPDEPGERSVETTYTSPVTGEEISYLDMRSRLRERRVNARERFVSSRQGLMEVYDKGTKLILVQVAE